MESTEGLMKIGEFARFADTNLRTLRYYEELRIMEPAARSEGGFRYYRRTDVNRIRLIRDLQELGLPLENIADLLAKPTASGARGEFVERVRRTLERYSELLAEKIRGLEQQQRRVEEARAKMNDCSQGCTEIPTDRNNHCEPCPISGVGLPQLLSALF